MEKENRVNIEKNLSCNVVQDLLPLYHDGVVLEKTAEEVSIHLEQCESCRTEYEELCMENKLVTTQDDFSESETADRKQGFVSMMKKNRRKGLLGGILLGVIVAVAILFIVYGYNIGFNVVKYEDVTIWYEKTEMIDIDGNTVDAFSICYRSNDENRIIGMPVGSNNCVSVRKSFGKDYGYSGHIYPMYDLDTGEPIIYNSENQLWFRFRDQTIIINLKDVAEELGLQ